MKITVKDHDFLMERINSLMAELEELGASSAICSVSCCIEGVGWLASHFSAGDPMACDGLAKDYLIEEEDDDGEMFFGIIGPKPDDEEGDEWKGAEAG